jgi:hypothetical protein
VVAPADPEREESCVGGVLTEAPVFGRVGMVQRFGIRPPFGFGVLRYKRMASAKNSIPEYRYTRLRFVR